MILSADAEKLISLLIGAGYKAYAVGGCVRDSIIGREMGDVDITTSARPEQTERVLEENGIRFVETGLKHGTVTAILNHTPYEVTTFRCDGEYNDNRHPESVEFINDLRGDLARRDFTINALAYNREEGIIDEFGGIDDIKAGIIRAVGDPDARFNEDALRILRALRFACVLGFELEDNTKGAVFRNRELLLNISGERVFSELKKLLLGKDVERILLEYRDVFAVILPEIKPCFDFEQHSRWHLYDVYTHTVKSLAISPKKDYMRFALLFHDAGKPYVKTTDENGQDHFKGHPEVSAQLVDKALSRLKPSNEFKYKVITLIKYHDLYITEKPSNIKKWLRVLGEDLTFDYIDLKIADLKTHNSELSSHEVDTLYHIRELTKVIIDSGEPYRISDLAVNGNDLKALGYSGKDISAELEGLIRIVSGSPECNTREKLIKQATQDLKK